METLKFDGKNEGGINKTTLKILDVDTIDAMPDAVNMVITTAVGQSADWSEFPVREENTDFQELESEKGAAMYPLTFTANVMKQSAAKTQLLYALSKKRLLIDFTDMNGERRMVGTLAEPVRMSLKRMDTRRQRKEANEYQLVFSRSGRTPVPYYNPA